MSIKKFGLIGGIFIGVIFILSIVLACIKTNTILIKNNPSEISIYNHSTISVTYSEANTKTKYYELLKRLKNIGNLSIMDRAIHQIDINEPLSQDENKNFPVWSDDTTLKNNVLKNNICVEIKFKKSQQQIVYVDGDSKRIDYNNLIFVIPENGKTQQVPIYFMISGGASYANASPMLMYMNCASLLKYIKSL